MAFTFKFNSNTMDVIMSVARKYKVNPSEAVDMIMATPSLIKEANDGSGKANKNTVN